MQRGPDHESHRALMATSVGQETASVGRYTIVGELGQGGMATVYLARQQDLDRLVALKELGVLRALDLELSHRFLREARMAGSLSHPNIVTVYDYFEHSGTPFIAMEYVEGGSLRAHVESGIGLAQVGWVLDGLLAGLSHAEQVGIVHRDIKPENVLVSGDGQVKITDFGIAKASDQVLTSTALTATGTTMGTPAYMAPEQALGNAVGPQTDLYAVGVIAFELLVGRTPFADTETPVAVLMRHVNETIAPVSAVRPDVDPRLSDWIARMVAKEPSERPPSADAAAEDLDEILTAVLGSRWRRGARLRALAGGPGEAGPRTAPTHRMSATAPWGERGDATMRPQAWIGAPVLTEAHEPAVGGARRRPRAAIVLLAVLAVAAVLAAAAGRDTGQPPASGGGSDPSSAREASDAASPARGGQSAPPGSGSVPSSSAPAAQSPPAAPTAPAPAGIAPPAGTALPAVPATGENADDGGDDGGTGGGGAGENADDGGDGP